MRNSEKGQAVKLRRSVAIAGLAGVAMAAGLALVGGGTAYAATTPPWEPDPGAVGTIAFYDASGNQITSGSINSQPFAAYAVASTTVRAGDTQADLRFAQPNPNASTALWSKDDPGGFTPYPLTTGPANIQTLSQTHPVASGATTDLALSDETAAFPNTDPSGAGCAYASTPAGCTNTAYQNVYQWRLVTSSGASQSSAYASADILVNPSAGTWTQLFPAVASATSTALTSSQNPTVTGTSVTLTATESPATAGSVQFKDGSSNIGSPAAVNGSGVATLNTSFSTTGAHSLSAVFTPTDTSIAPSTGTFTETVNPPATPTTTNLSVTQDGTAGHDVKLVATVSPTTAPGSLSFTDNGTAVPGTPTQAPAGTYTLDLPSGLAAGGHSIVAKFSPTDVTQFQASQSQPQSFVLQPAATGACAQTGSSCTDTQSIQVTVPVGTLTISTPYTSSSPLVLPDMQLTTNATMLTTNAPFQNIVVTDTRSGNLPYQVTALASPLTAGAGKTINAENVGLTGLAGVGSSGYAGNTVTHDNAAASPPVLASDTGSAGLGGSTPHDAIDTDHGLGTLTLNGTLTINAPTSTLNGIYGGTITFTVG
jgi:hypothetical protein